MLIPVYFHPAERGLQLLRGNVSICCALKSEGAAPDGGKRVKEQVLCLGLKFFVEMTCQQTHTQRNRCSFSTRVFAQMISAQPFTTHTHTLWSRCLDFFVRHSDIALPFFFFLVSVFIRLRAVFSASRVLFFFKWGAQIFESVKPFPLTLQCNCRVITCVPC